MDWTRLSRDEADRLALAQEHRVAPGRGASRERQRRGESLRHSLAWIAVWAVIAAAIWDATPS